MACSIGGGSATVGLTTLSELEGLTTEGTLVDLSLSSTREGDTEVFELKKAFQLRVTIEPNRRLHLNDSVGGLPTHIMNSILIAKPVRTLDLFNE